MAVVEQYNFRPDHAASALRAGNSRSFGLIIPDLETPVMRVWQNYLNRTRDKPATKF